MNFDFDLREKEVEELYDLLVINHRWSQNDFRIWWDWTRFGYMREGCTLNRKMQWQDF